MGRRRMQAVKGVRSFKPYLTAGPGEGGDPPLGVGKLITRPGGKVVEPGILKENWKKAKSEKVA